MFKQPALYLFIFFFSRTLIFAQHDTTRVNELNTHAWTLRSYDLDSALMLSNQALTILDKEFNDFHFSNSWEKKAYVKTYYYLGYFYAQKGDIAVPLDFYNKALKISEEMNYLHGKSLAIGGMGSFYMMRGNFPKALEYFFQALQIDELRGHKEGVLVRLSNIGNIYLNEKNYPKALEYFSKALKRSEELHDKQHAAIALGNLGISYYYMHEFNTALQYYTKALAIDKEIGNKSGISQNLNNIAFLFKDKKEYDQAFTYFSEALKLGEEQGSKEMIASELGNLGMIYTAKKDFSKAEDYLLRALKMADEMNGLDAKSDFELALSDLYTAWKKEGPALEHYKKYIVARDSIFNNENTEKTVRLEMNYEFDKKQAAAKAEHEKEIIAFEAENKIQKQLHLFLLLVIGLTLLTLFFVKRAYDNKKRIAGFLESESHRKEVLLQEVHHRINNNLQIISSLLTLQANSANDEQLYAYLKQSQNRIQSLSVLHDLLYQTDSPLEIDMRDYLNKILDFHRDVLRTRAGSVQVHTDVPNITFPTKKAVPIALIVNELVTNSLKYAFNGDYTGEIKISLRPEEGKKDAWLLIVSDNGKGLPEETGVRKDSLGLRLVTIMTKQMGGVLTKKNSPGASFQLSFSLSSSS